MCVHRVRQQRSAGENFPQRLRADSAVWPDGGGRVPAAAAEKGTVPGGLRGWGLSLHWKGDLSHVIRGQK